MKLRFAVLTIFALTTATAGYIAVPFYTAWSIREAIKSGDSDYLARKIDFASVRETLRPSLAQVALDIPDPGEAAPAPGLWKRIKTYWGRSAIDRLVDSYVTAEGLPKMFQWRQTYRQATGTATAAAQPVPLKVRLAKFWSRLKRAEFKSLTEFEIEMVDQFDASRSHIGLLKLASLSSGLDWKLTELRIRQSDTAGDATPPAESNESLPTDR